MMNPHARLMVRWLGLDRLLSLITNLMLPSQVYVSTKWHANWGDVLRIVFAKMLDSIKPSFMTSSDRFYFFKRIGKQIRTLFGMSGDQSSENWSVLFFYQVNVWTAIKGRELEFYYLYRSIAILANKNVTTVGKLSESQLKLCLAVYSSCCLLLLHVLLGRRLLRMQRLSNTVPGSYLLIAER